MTHEPPFCCETLAAQLRWACNAHERLEDCPDGLVRYYPEKGVFGLPVHDGGTSFVVIRYCPWCGADLERFTGRTD